MKSLIISQGGKKIYFKKSEVDEWVSKSRVSSIYEEQDELEENLSRTNNNLEL